MSGRRIDAVLADVREEVLSAMTRFDPFNSPHEGKSVIEEELDELWLEVKANQGRTHSAEDEARQIAAMAVRYIIDLCPGVKCFDHDTVDCPVCLAYANRDRAAS